MDPFHARLARVGLKAAARYGFCLAGGYAVQAHGMVERQSEDVDLFSTMAAEEDFPNAVEAVVTAFRSDHLDVTLQVKSPTFARLSVVDPETGTDVRVELGLDWRAHPPTTLEIGPVLHADDAVANKACALFGRGAVRDYIDVDGIVRSGRYTLPELLRLAAQHDPGFDAAIFAQALLAVQRFSHTAFAPYGMSSVDTSALIARIIDYAEQIQATKP